MSQSNKVSKSFGSVSTTGSVSQLMRGTGALGNVSVAKEVTIIQTTGAASGGLLAGAVGQIKTIAMVADGGDFVLTPTSLSGYVTVTFNDVGDTIRLLYSGSAWYVVHNSGCTLA